MNLPQQLEDKKKELNNLEIMERGEQMGIETPEENKKIFRNLFKHSLAERRLIECQAEIYILEQAIAEIKSKDEEIAQLKEKKWTEHTITPLYDFEFHNIDCMTDNNGNVNFFGYYNNDLNHPDYRPSSSIKLKELDAEFLYRLFTKTQQAEMQKQRQEILNKIDFLNSYPIWTNIIDKETGKKQEIPDELYPILDNFLAMIKKVLLEQLNQPKTEQ